MLEIKRVLGQKGRTTLPFIMRVTMDIRDNDFITYEMADDKSAITVRKAECNGIRNEPIKISEQDLISFIDELPAELQLVIFANLYKKAKSLSKFDGRNVRRVIL